MKLIWNTNKNANTFRGNYHFLNSTSWIYSLLSAINYKIIENINELENNDDLIIVDSQLNTKKKLYESLFKKCSSIYLIHLGDEGGTDELNFIYENCKHVWRTFGLPRHFRNNKISSIPIGYKSGSFLNHKKDILKRNYFWSFMGTTHGSSRHDLIFQHNEIKPNFTKYTDIFASKDSLKTEKYYEILQESIFVLVPHGYVHPETYRLYEGIECGCIPIVENPHQFYERFIPNNPFIKINLWKESSIIIKDLLNNKKALKEKSDEINIWWKNHKLEIKNKFNKIINV